MIALAGAALFFEATGWRPRRILVDSPTFASKIHHAMLEESDEPSVSLKGILRFCPSTKIRARGEDIFHKAEAVSTKSDETNAAAYERS